MTLTFRTISNIDDFCEIYQNIADTALITPYDQLIWVKNWYLTHTLAFNDQFICVAIYKNEALYMLLPLEIFKVSGRTQANLLGDKHANYHFPLLNTTIDPLDDADLHALKTGLTQLLKAHKIDLVCLDRLLTHYRHYENPLLKLSCPFVKDSLLYTDLPQNFTAFVQERRVGSGAKRDRKQLAAITKLGQWQCYIGKTDAQRLEILEAFYRFKPTRLKAKGVDNIFGGAEIQNFIAHLTAETAGDAQPLSLMALTLNGAIIAVSASLESKNHVAGMFNAIDPAFQDIIHPGHALLRHEIESYCTTGIDIFDLGTGEARYKRTWLRDEWEIRSLIIPLSCKGSLISAIIFAKAKIKNHIKHSKFLWPIIQKLRTLKGQGEP